MSRAQLATRSPTLHQASTTDQALERAPALCATEFRSHFEDVHRLVLFGLKQNRAQRFRHLYQDEFDDLVSFIWVALLEREPAFSRMTGSLAGAVLASVPIAIHEWRHSLRSWQMRCHVPMSALLGNEQREKELTAAEVEASLEVEAADEVLAAAEMMRIVEQAISTLPPVQRACIKRMLAGDSAAQIAKGKGVSLTTTRTNLLLAATKLRQALFGPKAPRCTTLEPQIVSSRVKARRARSNKYWKKLSDVQRSGFAPAPALTPENEWGGRKPAGCLHCGTSERKHKARGLCWLCYHRIATGQINGKRIADFVVILDTSPGAHKEAR